MNLCVSNNVVSKDVEMERVEKKVDEEEKKVEEEEEGEKISELEKRTSSESRDRRTHTYPYTTQYQKMSWSKWRG